MKDKELSKLIKTLSDKKKELDKAFEEEQRQQDEINKCVGNHGATNCNGCIQYKKRCTLLEKGYDAYDKRMKLAQEFGFLCYKNRESIMTNLELAAVNKEI